MKLKHFFNLIFAFFFVLIITTKINGQCYTPFIPLDCYGGLHLNLEAAFRQANERQISQWGWDNFNEQSYEKKMEVIKSEKYAVALDSIFETSKQYILNKIGEDNYCQRIGFGYNGFSFYIRYHPKILTGKFTFKFCYQPIACWNGAGINLEFNFKELEDGTLGLEMPKDFPRCFEGDCEFKMLSPSEMAFKLIDLGLIDGTEELRSQRYDNYSYAIEKNSVPYQRHFYIFDNKNGAYLKDTIVSAYGKDENFLHKNIDNSDRIVDATCIGTKEFRGGNGYLYTNHFFKTHHTLKGKRIHKTFAIAAMGGKGESWSHGLNLPRKNVRSIIFLKKLNPDFLKVIADQIDTTRFAQWGVNHDPYRIPFYSRIKVYSELFPLITARSKSKLFSNHNINNTTDETKQWLKKYKKLRKSKRQGLEIWMYNFYWNKKLNRVNGNVVVRSTKDFSYLLEKEFIFQYDTMYVPPFAVKNKSITISKFKSGVSLNPKKIPEATLTNNYDITFSDVNANRFKVKIKAKSIENLGQLIPSVKNQTLFANTLFNIDFKIKENILKDTFELHLVAEPFKKVGKYYNPISKRKKKFAFQRIITPTIKTSLSNAYPVIENVFPKEFSIGDTITIFGQNLLAFKDNVYCSCSVIDKKIEFRRHCLISKNNILFASYEKIKFVVPKDFNFHKDGLTKLFPSTGTIKVKYEKSQELIYRLSDNL